MDPLSLSNLFHPKTSPVIQWWWRLGVRLVRTTFHQRLFDVIKCAKIYFRPKQLIAYLSIVGYKMHHLNKYYAMSNSTFLKCYQSSRCRCDSSCHLKTKEDEFRFSCSRHFIIFGDQRPFISTALSLEVRIIFHLKNNFVSQEVYFAVIRSIFSWQFPPIFGWIIDDLLFVSD